MCRYLDSAGVPSEEVLRAPFGGQVGEVAGVLRDLFKRNESKKAIFWWGKSVCERLITFMFHLLFPGMAVPTAVEPSWNTRLLQASEESTYTKYVEAENYFSIKNTFFSVSSRCSPAFSPQMTGGALPPGLVTEKVSVRHWVEVVAACILWENDNSLCHKK